MTGLFSRADSDQEKEAGRIIRKMSSDKNENTVPAITADVTEAEVRMNLKDKLKLIDKEVRELYEFCVKSGYSPEQIEKCAAPLLAVKSSETRKTWLTRLGYLAVFIAFIAFLFYYGPAYNQLCIYAKLASMKVIPYWNWTYIYEEDCFVNNPYAVEETLTKKDCKNKCSKLKEIERMSEANAEQIADMLFDQVPVVITDGSEEWKARSEFSLEFLAKLYEENKVLKDTTVCNFQTTSELGHVHPGGFLSDVVSGKVKGSFQTYWENCDKEPAKILRQYYRRPYFLPPMVEGGEGNWMIVSSGGNKSLSVTWDSSLTWMTQITGHSKIRLRPNEICKGICGSLRTELNTGESILFTNEMWSFSYKPLGDEPVIAIGSIGTFDKQ